jgi:septum formation protein
VDLLAQVGITPDVIDPAEVDEAVRPPETPRAAATRLARLKAATVAQRHPHGFVLAADTIVAVGRRILGKPACAAEAEGMLGLLSGRGHRVYTGVCLIAPGGDHSARLSETRVRFKRLSPGDLGALIASDQWRGVAGGYQIQGLAGGFVVSLSGSFTGVVGLPLYETAVLLAGQGISRR